MSLMGDMIAKWNSVLNVDGLVEDKIQDFPHTVSHRQPVWEKKCRRYSLSEKGAEPREGYLVVIHK